MELLIYVIIVSCAICLYAKSENITSSECHTGFYKLPKCVNTPGIYYCQCGPGFRWNGEVCFALSADSRLEFTLRDNRTFTVLLGKAFPGLKEFTITMWMTSGDVNNPGTLLSYNGTNEADHDIVITGGRNGTLRIGRKTVEFPLNLKNRQWTFLAISWNISGEWKVYQDSTLKGSGNSLNRSSPIQGSGDWILGQSKFFTTRQSFFGNLSHVNIWNETISKPVIDMIRKNCNFKYCGNLVEWVDFRSGTRGHTKLRWPSSIPLPDTCHRNVAELCDDYCSRDNGTKCVLDVSHNLLWPRTRVGETVTFPCPGLQHGKPPRRASRTCRAQGKLDGYWSEPDMSACISSPHMQLWEEVNALDHGNRSIGTIDQLARSLYDITKTSTERDRNPTDMQLEVTSLLKLINLTQENALYNYTRSDNATNHPGVNSLGMTYLDVNMFAHTAVQIVSMIIDESRREAWDATKPRGTLALEVLHVMDRLQELLAENILSHSRSTRINTAGKTDGLISIVEENLALYMSLESIHNFNGIKFPTADNTGCASFPSTFFTNWTGNNGPEVLVLSIARYNNTLPTLLPNHPDPIVVKHYRDMDEEFAHKEDNINTVILSQRFYNETGLMQLVAIPVPIVLSMKYAKKFNVSNPVCVSLDDSEGIDNWEWIVRDCYIVDAKIDGATCNCTKPGTYAITTDMYDINWRPDAEPRFELTPAAYIGILSNLILCGSSLVLYIFLRCSTDTVAVHRNLAVSMFCLHFFFLIGVTRTEVEIICQIFTVAIHYFFAATFCWICNEAFNLYVEVINSIHADTQQQRPMLRYYIIGWVFPAVLVGALLGSNWNNNYFSDEVCFVSNQHVWLLIGPACGVWAITMVVLMYTGRDIMESAYSKDREENKNVWNHCKGCWVQITLMVIAWGFGLCSLKIYGLVVQILFAMFDILQGAFFFMFFCMLNAEVSRAMNDHRMSFTKMNVKSSKLARSSKYSIYRRYVPPGVGTSSEPDPSESYSSKSDEFRGRRPIRRQKFRPIDSSPEKELSSDGTCSPIKHVMLNMPESHYNESTQLLETDEIQIEIPKKKKVPTATLR